MVLADLVGLPDVPVVLFERPPLVLALCQIRFASELSITDSRVVARFQQAIRDQYPIARLSSEIQVDIPLGIGNARIEQGRPWHFTDLDDIWKVSLTPEFLTLETRRYDGFEDFLTRLQTISEAFATHIGPVVVTRLGLRYVNEIRLTDERWEKAIQPQLLGPLAAPEFLSHVAHALQQIVLRFPEGHGLIMHHGLVPTGSAIQPRANEQTPSGPFYLLDFDIFQEFSGRHVPAMDPDRICRDVEAFNRTVYRLFRWAVTDAYTSTLGVRG